MLQPRFPEAVLAYILTTFLSHSNSSSAMISYLSYSPEGEPTGLDDTILLLYLLRNGTVLLQPDQRTCIPSWINIATEQTQWAVLPFSIKKNSRLQFPKFWHLPQQITNAFPKKSKHGTDSKTNVKLSWHGSVSFKGLNKCQKYINSDMCHSVVP